MRTRISKMSLTVFVVLLLLSGFLLSVPGDYWPWFAVMSVFAVVPVAVLGGIGLQVSAAWCCQSL